MHRREQEQRGDEEQQKTWEKRGEGQRTEKEQWKEEKNQQRYKEESKV